MTEENNQFKAPSLPQQANTASANPAPVPSFSRPAMATAEGQQAQQNAQDIAPSGVDYSNNFAADLKLSPKVLQTKFVGGIAFGLLLFGMFLGCAVAPKPQTRQVGLGDVVPNPIFQEKSAPRCGQTDVNKACVLYIMNARPMARTGRDFFEEAANITGVPRYTIQINNASYAEKLLNAGYIAQIYIPSRR